MNFGVALAGSRIPGTKVDLAQVIKENADKKKMVDESLRMILAGEVSAATRESLVKQVDPADPIAKVVGLILGTPEFQRQ
jgi:hypothetical protein